MYVSFNFGLEGEPKYIFYYQCDVENYTNQAFDFLLFDKHEYTHGIFRSVIQVSIFMLRVYITSFVPRDLLTESILIFTEWSFGGTCFFLAFNTLHHKFFSMKINSLRILVNPLVSDVLKKGHT